MRQITARSRRIAGATTIALLLTGTVAACSDDDDDITNEGPGTTVDLDPGAGSGLPGDAGDETTTTTATG